MSIINKFRVLLAISVFGLNFAMGLLIAIPASAHEQLADLAYKASPMTLEAQEDVKQPPVRGEEFPPLFRLDKSLITTESEGLLIETVDIDSKTLKPKNSLTKPSVKRFSSHSRALMAIQSYNGRTWLGTLWEHFPASGRWIAFYGPSCSMQGFSNFANMGFNDIASGIQIRCAAAVLFEHANFSENGIFHGYRYSQDYKLFVGKDINDKGSSILFNGTP